MEHQPGEIIYERYTIVRFISRGGFGETYIVEDKRSPGLTCLLKYLRPPSNDTSTLTIAQEKFRQEADVLRRLGNHNQIPQLYDYFEENQRFYLVQEYIEGSNLEEIRRTQLLSEREVITVLCDVLRVLDYLSNCNVIHRDIKPANLIRRNDGKIFVVDFGAVKEVSTLTVNAQGQTILTVAIGTPFYMPREQNDGRPEFASDIYALGITAFVLLTGRIPPERNQRDEIIWNRVPIGSHLATILDKMLRLNYKERYQRAADVLADLEPLTLLGETLNSRYKIKSYMGGGGFSHTYLTEDLQRPYRPDCVIKQLKLRTNNQQIWQEAQNRFATAVQAVEKLSHHQQISRLWDHFQTNQEFYLVYGFIEGEPLSRSITAGDRLSEAEVITLLKDVLQVLSFIHKQDIIIHGDIKPSNLIKRQQDNKIVLINFAEFKQIVTLEMNYQGGIVLRPGAGGTDGYMPPEQLQNRLQPCSDIYALGMTAIQALTGVSPDRLQKDSHGEVIWRNQAQVSPKLARILTKMVRSQIGQRYQSAQKVLNALNASSGRRKFVTYLPVLGILGVLSICLIIYIYKEVRNAQANQLYNDGFDFLNQGDYEKAIEAFDKATDINPNLKQAWLNQSYAYGKLNLFDKQFSSCEKVIKIDPNDSGAWLCLGNSKLAEKEYLTSIQYFNRTIALACNAIQPDAAKDCAYAWNSKGLSLLALRKPDDARSAIKAFEEAIAKKIDPHISWTYKGEALLFLNQPQEALEAFKKAQTIESDYQFAKTGEQKALRLLGQ